MRTTLKLTATITTILFALVAWSCTEPSVDKPVDKTTSVTFNNLEVNLGCEEQEAVLTYVINNGITGIDIVAEPMASWITDIKAQEGVLRFSVLRNDGDKPREAKIKVRYPNLDDIYIAVKQSQFDIITFDLEITSATSTSCTSLITPSNDDYVYIAYMSEVDYFLSLNITLPEELFLDDYKYYMGFAEQYDAPYLKEFFLANYFAYEGATSIDWTGMMPGKEYVLYVYAIEFNEANNDYWMASPITYQLVTLSGEELFDVSFDVKVDVNGPNATYDITPQNWDGKYYLTVYEEGDYMYRDANNPANDSYAKLVSDVWLNTISELLVSGYSADQLMEIMCLEGHAEYSELLKGDTNYAITIYAVDMVDGLPQVVSKPQVVNFRTEAIGASDMTIDIRVENKYVRVADIIITPSTNEYYTAAIVATEEVPSGDNAAIIKWLNNSFAMDSYRGEIFSHINTLAPDTEYSIFAYGYYGEVVTTDLFRYDFKTDPESECENSVLGVEFNGPYSLAELEAYDSDLYYNYGMFETMGWYAMWAEISTAQPTQDMFYCIYSAQELNVYGEQAIFDDLVSYVCPKTQLLTGENGALYVMCATVMDYRGNYSDMWVSEPFMYDYSATSKRPIEELIEKLHGTQATTNKLKVLNTKPVATPLRTSVGR
jgi:hypothetical protein